MEVNCRKIGTIDDRSPEIEDVITLVSKEHLLRKLIYKIGVHLFFNILNTKESWVILIHVDRNMVFPRY